MRKIFLLFSVAMLVWSCKPTFNHSAQSKMKGNWVVSDVEYRGAKGIIVNAFDDADAKCFKGSKWFFVSNNNTGNYTLTGSEKCPTGTTQIKWLVTPENYFEFKKIFDGEKAKRVKEGYSLKVQNQTENSFELVDTSSVDGKPVQIVYFFKKA